MVLGKRRMEGMICLSFNLVMDVTTESIGHCILYRNWYSKFGLSMVRRESAPAGNNIVDKNGIVG